MKEKFIQDLQLIYDELQSRQRELNGYYKLLENEEHPEADEKVSKLLNLLELPKNDETILAALKRIVNLREDALIQMMQKEGFSKEQIISKREIAYRFVKEMHLLRHEYLIAWIIGKNLLTPFYQTLI
ncbi:MAG TPA: invasion protein, partial [Desulfobacterales bacterium]|nr:invasion protein [Desulfobacterales bacterium]